MNKGILKKIVRRGLKKAQEGATPPPFPQYEDWPSRVTRATHRGYAEIFQHLLYEIDK